MRLQDIEKIHRAGLRILERTGVEFHDSETVAVLAERGFPVEGRRVRFPEERVEAARRSAPGSFVLRGRVPGRDLVFGDGLVVAAATGAPFVLEGTTRRAGTLADLVSCVKVMHMSRNIDMLGMAVEAQDVPPDGRYRRGLFTCLTASDKPMEYPMSRPEYVRAAFDTAEILWGADWHRESRMLTVLNSTSPLQFERDTCRALVAMAERRQPVCVTPCVMGGATGPATMAGILALQHAEALAGLVLTQTINEGAPFIYGGTSSITSMLTGDLLVGVPQYWAIMTATVELAHYLGLPCRAGGGLTDAHLPDMQAGIETAMGLAAVARAGVHFVLHGTGILSSFNAVSFEKFIIDDELVGMIRARNLPIVVDEETLALDVVDAVGPGGNFLLEAHTHAHCRDYERPTFFNRRRYDLWLSRGGRDLAAAARERFRETVEGYQPPDLDGVTMRQLTDYCLR